MPLHTRSNETETSVGAAPQEEIRTRVTHEGHVPPNAVPAGKSPVVVGKLDGPIGGDSGLLSVLGDDERSRILETERAPFRMIASLAISGPWGEFVGTGWFAGPRTVVTAGHCVYDKSQMGGWADQILVTPGRDGTDTPFGTTTARRFASVDRWVDDRDPDFDIGVIHLDEPLGDETGWFSVAAMTNDELNNALVNVSGYPARPGGGQQQWWAKNRIRALTPRRVFYDVDTSGGQSGGPVYLYEDSAATVPIVVAIHAYGLGGTPSSIPLVVNSAPRIVPEVVALISQWVDENAAAEAEPA